MKPVGMEPVGTPLATVVVIIALVVGVYILGGGWREAVAVGVVMVMLITLIFSIPWLLKQYTRRTRHG